MSWLAEEWKEKLPPDALKNIQTMETSLEKLQKDLAQYSFKTEALEACNETIKQKLDEKLKQIKLLERENLDYQTRLEEEILKTQSLTTNLKKKENQIHDYNAQLKNYKEKLESQQCQVNKLENELDNLDVKYGIDTEQAKEGNLKLNEAYEISKQRVEELKERLEELRREKHEQEICYESKIETILQDEIKLQETNESLKKAISSLQLENQAINTEKLNVEIQLEELRNEINRIENKYQNNTNGLNNAIELNDCIELNDDMELNDANESIDINELKDVIKRKDLEINELKFQLSTLQDQEFVGDYLGINVKKICSDTEIEMTDPDKPRPYSIIRQNKALQNEIDRLNTLLKESSQYVTYQGKHDVTEHVIQVNPVHYQEGNVDSGLALRGDSAASTECGKEVILSRVEQVHSVEPIANNQLNNKDLETKQENNHNDQFKHGIKCVHLSEELFESKSVLNSYKNENIKVKHELSQMKEIYEHHMKVCNTQNKISKKSSEKSLTTTNSDMDMLVEDLQRKLSEEEHSKKEILNTLKQKESQCIDLESRLSSNDNISATAVCKLEELVDVILQQRSSTASVNSEKITPNLEQFVSQLTQSFLSLHDEVVEGNQATKETIQISTDEILSHLQKRHVRERERKNSDTYRKGSESNREYSSRTRYRPVSGNGIDELENIKERIGGVQEIIYEYCCEIKRIEDERDHIQEELIKMVELMKRKDEEYGRLSCLYEDEKRKVEENDTIYRQEMDELKREQLEIYQEYRDMCDNIKKKEIELLNKTKQSKLFVAEWREKEDRLNENISKLQQENTHISDAKSALQEHLNEKTAECDLLISRLVNSEEQLRTIFNNLSRVEDMFYKAKTQGLYK